MSLVGPYFVYTDGSMSDDALHCFYCDRYVPKYNYVHVLSHHIISI